MGNAWCDVHGVHETKALLNAASLNEFLNGVRDVYETAPSQHFEP